MHPQLATLMLLSGAFLLAGCEAPGLSDSGTTAPPPAPYETVTPPVLQPAAGTQATAAAPASVSGSTAPVFRPERTRVVSHTVATGESLWSLARKFETTIDEIRQANQLTGDIIRAGQVLKIPTSMVEGDPFSAPPPVPVPFANPSPASAAAPPPSSPSPSSASASNWTVTPPVTAPTSSGSSAPQYRIPEPVILPPPGTN